MYIKSHFDTLHSLSGQYFTEFLKKDTPNFACYLVNSIILHMHLGRNRDIHEKLTIWGRICLQCNKCSAPKNFLLHGFKVGTRTS